MALSPQEVLWKFILFLHTVAKNVTRLWCFKLLAPLLIPGTVLSTFPPRLNQIHSLWMILTHPLLPPWRRLHPPPFHQALLAFHGLWSLVSESEWNPSSLISSGRSSHISLWVNSSVTFLFILFLLSNFLYLHCYLPFFWSSSLLFLSFHVHVAQSTSPPLPLSPGFPWGVLFRSHRSTFSFSVWVYWFYEVHHVNVRRQKLQTLEVLMSSWSPDAMWKLFLLLSLCQSFLPFTAAPFFYLLTYLLWIIYTYKWFIKTREIQG